MFVLPMAAGVHADDTAPTVTVTGIEPPLPATTLSSRPEAAPASVTVIDRRQIDRTFVGTYGDLFRGVTGVMVNEYGQGGVAYGLTIRGFDDGNHGRDVAVYLDGMPLNVTGSQHTNGYVDLAQLIPETLERVEVVRGPFSVFAGNHAIGGAVFLHTDRNPQSQLRLTLDQFGRARAVPIAGFDAGPGRLMVAGELVNGSGWNDNSRIQRLNLFTRYVMPMGDGVAALRVQAYDGDADAPGYLNRQAIETGGLDARRALSGVVGDRKKQQNIVFNYLSNDEDGRDGGSWAASAYLNNDARDRWTAAYANQLPGAFTSAAQETDQLLQWGADARRTRTFAEFVVPTQIVAGASFNREDIDALNYNVDEARRLLGRTVNRRVLTDTASLYGQVQVKPVERLKLVAGLRYDHLRYGVDGRLDDALVGQRIDSTASGFSPKVGAAFALTQSEAYRSELFANWAEGFKAPSPFYDLPLNRGLGFSPVRSVEAGLQGGRNDGRVTWRVAAWRTEQSREAGQNPVTLVFENFGRTRREGVDVEGSWVPTDAWRIFSNASTIDATSQSATPGNDAIPRVPEYLFTLGATWATQLGAHRWDVSAFDTLVGPMALNGNRSLETQPYHRLTGRVAYGHESWKGALVTLQVVAYQASRNLEETTFDFGGFAATSAKAPYRVMLGTIVPF
ncbi:MAG: TonB-dependent receptor [Burkholderiales bacterium]|nr:TonB-dependent receptor [Burkholderiales bacterium]